MAQLLRISHISYTYPGAARSVLDDVSLSFPQGWTGVVGTNGCGKTTLAQIAAGAVEPTAGSVTPMLSSAYCAQDAGVEPEGLSDFACDWASEAVRLRRALRIEDDMLWHFPELSCGEQKKIQVAVSLWRNPELLVIDEPTNHVDAACRSQLMGVLRGFGGIGLLISHDRELLDGLVDQCVSFESGSVMMRPGSYTAGRRQAAIEAEAAVRLRGKAKAELSRLEVEQRKRRDLADRSASRRSARGLDKHDSDGRARRRLAVFSGQDGKATRLASRMDGRVERAQERLGQLRVEKRYEGDLWVDATPSPRKALLHLPACELPCGSGRTLRVPELYVGNKDHLGITGPNGAGKSTFMRHVVSRLSEDQGLRFLYMEQEIGSQERDRALGMLKSLTPSERGRLLSVVAQLDSDPGRILDGTGASPGELRKVMLAHGFLRQPELILLDEPTNHLDIHSIEALERALAAFPGALVLVSHDERFLEAATSERLRIEGGVLQRSR